MPIGVLRAFANGMTGKRLISFGGLIKEAAKELEIKDLDEADEENGEEEVKICTHCGSQELDELILRWSITANQYFAVAANDALEAETQRIIDGARQVRDREQRKQ